jgi:hypothetical protein
MEAHASGFGSRNDFNLHIRPQDNPASKHDDTTLILRSPPVILWLDVLRCVWILDEEMAATFLGHYTASRFSWNNLISDHQHGMALLAFQG